MQHKITNNTIEDLGIDLNQYTNNEKIKKAVNEIYQFNGKFKKEIDLGNLKSLETLIFNLEYKIN